MRIALDVSIQDRPDPTGVERAQVVLIDALLASGADHDWLLLGGRRLPEHWADHPRVERHAGGSGPAWRQLRLPDLLRRNGASLLHSPVAALPLAARCPLLASLHELPWGEGDDASTATEARPGDHRLAHRLATAAAARRAARLLCPSQRTARQLRALHPGAASRLRVVPHGVHPAFSVATVDDGEARRELAALGVPQHEPYLLAVGRLRMKKNLAALVSAHDAARHPAVPSTLVLAGPPGDASRELRARARAGLHDRRVVLPGYVPDRWLPALYRGAHAVLTASLLEGYGLTVLEAMAVGVPVLASAQGPVEEAIGDAALRVDVTDAEKLAWALEQVCADDDLRESLVVAGRRRAALRSPEAMAARVLAIYAELQ